MLRKAAISASTACASSACAPLRRTSVNGSAKRPGWESWKMLVSVTTYHFFAGEVEASNAPTIRRLTPLRRHQVSRIALMMAPPRSGRRSSQSNAPHDLPWWLGCIWSICPLFALTVGQSAQCLLTIGPSESGRGEDFRAPHPVGWLGTP